MNKQEFLINLRKGLSGLPKADIDEYLTFYSEMIDDRIEEGISEEIAVYDIGDVDKIVSQIIEDIPLTRLMKEKIKPNKKLKAWEIILLVLGSPIWLSVLLCLFAVIVSVYVSIWSVIISLWVTFISLVAGGLFLVAGGIVLAITNKFLTGLAVIGVGIFCTGLSVFMFFASKAVTKGVLILTKKLLIAVKNCFIKKEEA